MKHIRTFTLFVCLLWGASSIWSQNDLVFRHLDVSQGFPENTILGLFNMPDGRLGLRTTASISFYDGGESQNYEYTPQSVYNWDYTSVSEEMVDSEGRIWMKAIGTLTVFDSHRLKYINNIDSLLRTMQVEEPLADLYMDRRKNFWFVTKNQDVLYYNKEKDKLTTVCEAGEQVRKNGSVSAVAATDRICRIIYRNGVIRCWDIQQEKFVQREDFLVPVMEHRYSDAVLVRPQRDGSVWLATNQYVGHFDPSDCTWRQVPGLQFVPMDICCSLDVDTLGNAWVGTTRGGIFIINGKNLSSRQVPSIPLLDGTTIDNDVIDIAVQPNGQGVWLGLYNQGVCYYHRSLEKFTRVNSTSLMRIPNNKAWTDNNIRSLLAMPDGKILVGTQQGLYSYDPRTQRVTNVYLELNGKLCRRLFRDSKGRVWVGTFRNGLYGIEGGKVTHYSQPRQRRVQGFDYENIRNIFEDSNGNLWVSISGGLCRFSPESGTFDLLNVRHPELNRFKRSLVVVEQPETGYLIAGGINGLYCYDPRTDRAWIPADEEEKDPCYEHSNDNYTCILRDSRGLMWFCTYNGLNIVDQASHRLYKLNERQGMLNHVAKMAIEDDNGDMWVSTSNGLCKIEVSKSAGGDYQFDIVTFNSEDGLQQGEYFDGCACKDKDGVLYFGGVNGFDKFQPDNIVYNGYAAKPILTGFSLFNNEVEVGKPYNGKVILKEAIGFTERVNLDYKENFFTINFSALNFVNPSKTYYAYKLEGFDNDWIEQVSTHGIGSATYNNLDPGTYRFRVRSANNDKVWCAQEATLTIVINPPFWDTVYARVFYVLLAIALISASIYYFLRKSEAKIRREKEREAARQREELEQMKFRFFTNISHEFRTPLSLIITPLDAVIRKLTDENLKAQLTSVYKNAQQMLELVNQLLDFRKLEMTGEKLNLRAGYVTDYIPSLFTPFQSLAEEKHIHYVFEGCDEPIYMYFDAEKLKKIVYNLLSNAFKFTPNGGDVGLRTAKVTEEGRTYLLIEVSDSGIGISEEDQKHIFERFYQVRSDKSELGSGIGLHLIHEYVKLYDGKLHIQSHLGGGSVFTVYIPTDLTAEEPAEDAQKDVAPDAESEEKQPEETRKANRHTVLVVEDNRDFRNFLVAQLAEEYNVYDAADGEEALRKATEVGAELIVSDVMMPKMDGFELCKHIKENIETSHIPVILLSARGSEDVKISGYEAGADSYIVKPFSIDLLLTRMRKLIEQQKTRRESFNKNLKVEPSSITITSLDEQLIKRALSCVEKNMDNCDYTVEQLSSEVGMTRMSLYRKLQSIVGQTPTEFIRSIRLKRAAQLLQGSQMTILQISDMVGYNSSRAFSKNFKEMFGVLPSQYAEQYNASRTKNGANGKDDGEVTVDN